MAKPACPISREALGKFQARRRGIAGTHDGDHRLGKHGGIAAHGQKRRGVIDHLQARWVVGFPERDETHAEPVGGFDLPLGLGTRADAAGTGCAAAPCESGQRCERRPGAAAVTDQRCKRARPDVLAADQAQRVDPLLVSQLDAWLLLGSHGGSVRQMRVV